MNSSGEAGLLGFGVGVGGLCESREAEKSKDEFGVGRSEGENSSDPVGDGRLLCRARVSGTEAKKSSSESRESAISC